MGEQIFQGIVDDVNASSFYFILTDEVTSHNVEHLAICIRFLNCKQKDTKEEFLTFVPLEWITGEAISQAILQFYRKAKFQHLTCVVKDMMVLAICHQMQWASKHILSKWLLWLPMHTAVVIPLILLLVKVAVYLKYEMFLIVCKAAVDFSLIALNE